MGLSSAAGLLSSPGTDSNALAPMAPGRCPLRAAQAWQGEGVFMPTGCHEGLRLLGGHVLWRVLWVLRKLPKPGPVCWAGGAHAGSPSPRSRTWAQAGTGQDRTEVRGHGWVRSQVRSSTESPGCPRPSPGAGAASRARLLVRMGLAPWPAARAPQHRQRALQCLDEMPAPAGFAGRGRRVPPWAGFQLPASPRGAKHNQV